MNIQDREKIREDYMESHEEISSYLEIAYCHGELKFTDEYVLWLENQVYRLGKEGENKNK